MEMTWYTRELPVLNAALELLEEHDYDQHPNVNSLAPLVGLGERDVAKALRALGGEYLDVYTDLAGWDSAMVRDVYPAGRRAAGQWPTPEFVAQRLIAGLEAAAVDEADPERKSKLKQTAVFLGSSGKDLLINLVASVIAKSAGLG